MLDLIIKAEHTLTQYCQGNLTAAETKAKLSSLGFKTDLRRWNYNQLEAEFNGQYITLEA